MEGDLSILGGMLIPKPNDFQKYGYQNLKNKMVDWYGDDGATKM